MDKYKWMRGKRYYYYGSYDSWKDAYKIAKVNTKKIKKNKYFIETVDSGFLFPQIKYRLYMSRVFIIGGSYGRS
jgi:hypothetical protein